MSSWKQVELGSVGTLTMGQSPPSEYYNSARQGMPFLQGCAQFGEHVPASDVHTTAGNKIARSGSVLISVRAPVGRLNIADQNYVIGRGVAAIEGRGHSTRFLYYLLNNATTQLEAVAQGSTFSAINSSQLRSFKVLVPTDPAVEQAIVELLELIGTCIEHQRFVIAKQERVRAGLLQTLLTRGIDKNGEIRPRVLHSRGQNNAIPNGWTKTTIGGLGKWRGGLTPSKQVSRYWAGDHLWVSPKDVKAAVLHDTEDHLSQDAIDSCALRIFPAGSIFTVFRSGILKHSLPIATCAAPFTVNQDIKVLEPNDGVSNAYAFYLMRFHSSSLLRKAVKAGTTVESIDTIVFLEYPVALPRPEEQALIVRALEQQNNELETDRKVHAKLHRLKTGLMRDLLSGRVSVEPLLDLPPASTANMEKP